MLTLVAEMASLNGFPDELIVMVGDNTGAFHNPADRERTFAALSLTNRCFHLIFNDDLYKHDARNRSEAMSWGAFLGSVATMERSRATGAFNIDQDANLHPAVVQALAPCRPAGVPSVLAVAGGQNDVLDWLLQEEIVVDNLTKVQH